MIDKILKISSAKIKTLILFSVLIGLNSLIPAKSLSCPIPVFRYALEYWEADSYNLEVFYQNALNPEDEELMNYLLRASSGNEMNANLKVNKIDMEGDTDNIPPSYSSDLSPDSYPWMVLRYPRVSGINEVIWSGPLNRENVNLLLDSPVRESIAGKLAGDASAVWVLLESGDKQKDRAALNLLEKEINRLEQTLELSNFELWGDSQDIKDENIPEIKFEIFSVSRHDSGEEYLVEMLLNSEDDLKEIESEPIVFPVYGRGIALYAIVGEGINKWNLREAAEFLTGDCSCQAKAGNPGVDLLLSMDWDKHIENLTNLGTANPLSGMGDFRNKEEEVKRRLDSATIKRLGTKSKKRESRETDPEKVVLLDISSDNKQENEEMADADTVAENDKALATGPGDKKTNKEKEKQQEQKQVDLELSDKESSKGSVEEPKEKRDLKQKFMLALAGVIGLVLLSGIVLYYKNIK